MPRLRCRLRATATKFSMAGSSLQVMEPSSPSHFSRLQCSCHTFMRLPICRDCQCGERSTHSSLAVHRVEVCIGVIDGGASAHT